jgi:hypothetical protein
MNIKVHFSMLQKCKIDCHLARGVAHVELMDPIGKLNISSLIQSPFMKMQMKLFCAINFPVSILFGTICFKTFSGNVLASHLQ